MQFEHQSELLLPLEQIDDQQAADWVEDRLVDFTRTYLQLGFADQYQRDNLVTDPVAGMRISKLIAQATAEYGGHSWYFLTEENRDRFVTDPTLFVAKARE